MPTDVEPSDDDAAAVKRAAVPRRLDAGRRRLIAGGLSTMAATLVALAPVRTARGAAVLAVRVWPAPDYTRVTIELDEALQFSHFLLSDATPLRMVVDITGIDLTSALRELVGKVQADDPYISMIRIGQNRAKVVRLVIELKEAIRPQVFALAPAGPYQHRLVLDLFPTVPRDPLLALLQDRGAANGAGTPLRSDASEPKAAEAKSADTKTAADALTADEREFEREIEKAARATEAPSPPLGAGTPSASPPARRAPAGDGLKRIVTIAIDPGHGGEDPGAVGKRGTYEKTVTLSIGRLLAGIIERDSPMRVLLTRDADFFVPLHQRVQKARAVQADLFISIHADAWIRPDARGSSVFALSERGATSTAAAWMARRENDADLIGGINLGAHEAGLARVLLDLSTTAQINDSLRFGGAVLRELERINRLHKQHVEQAGFAVLKAPDIPSILVETAFISNPEEELRLSDQNYQKQMAAAIFRGVHRFFEKNPPVARNPIG